VEVNIRLKNDLQYVTWPNVSAVVIGLDRRSTPSPTLLDNRILPVIISRVVPRSTIDPAHCLLSKERHTVPKSAQKLVFCTFEAPRRGLSCTAGSSEAIYMLLIVTIVTELPPVIVIRKSPIYPSTCCDVHVPGTVNNKLRRNERQIGFGDCLLPFGSE
jgi:hypothetical protein